MTITLQTILLICSLISFLLGAGGVQARISWDELGKAFFVAAVIAGLTIKP